MKIRDSIGRSFKKLRVSLIEACNYRCTYCMPEQVIFKKQSNLLSPEQIEKLVRVLNHYGLDEVRLTGGEPTLRSDLIEIVERLSQLDLVNLGMTTNAHLLFPLLRDLKRAGLMSINVSLDSLDQENFKRITRRDGLQNVLRAIYGAKEVGLKVKVNMVVMRGINEHELLNFVNFSQQNKIEVRFLEVMKIGIMQGRFEKEFISSDEMISLIEPIYPLNPIAVSADSTSFCYNIGDHGRIGFIASESKPFCGNCSRLRLDSTGVLRGCLMKNEGINILGMESDELGVVLQNLINQKPIERIISVDQPMYQIGG